MTDTATGAVAIVIALSHAALVAVAWAWAGRSRHVGFLALLAPTAAAWLLAGLPLVRALTYGTRPLASPRGGLQTAGFVAILVGSGALVVGFIGIAVTLLVRTIHGRGRRLESPRGSQSEERARWT